MGKKAKFKETFGLVADVKCRECGEFSKIFIKLVSVDCSILYLVPVWVCGKCKKLNTTSIKLERMKNE